MTSTGLKEYTLKINGVTTSIKEVTTLEAAVNSLDSAVKKANTNTAAAAKATATKARALTEEEKAAKKLIDTQKRIEQANSDANKAQIQANIALRERTREITRQIQVSEFAEGSISQMGMSLTDLRLEYERLSPAQRAAEDTGGDLLKRIQALDAEYKSLRESTGNFRDSVGNYGKAVEGLERLSMDLKDAGQASVSLATSLVGSSRMMGFFGSNTESMNESLDAFNKIMVIAVGAQSLYTVVTQEGIVADGLALTVSTTRTIQLRAQAAAQALATRGTVAATVAQTAFNVVASANPYVLLALALVAVGTALFAFSSDTKDAADAQAELNARQAEYLEQLDREAAKLKDVGAERVRSAEQALELLQAQGAKTAEIRAAEDRLFNERNANNARLRGFYGGELEDLEANRAKIEELTATLKRLNKEKATGAEEALIGGDVQDIEKAIETIQGQIDNLGKSVTVALEIKADQAQIEQEARVTAATRAKVDREEGQTRVKEAAELAKTRRDLELTAIRETEDLRISLIENSAQRERAAAVAQYDRQIEDLRARLASEKELTIKARQELNAQILLIDQVRFNALEVLQQDNAAKELETLRAAEDSRTALIIGEQERRTAEINLSYDRQVDDLFKRLETEKDLTEAQQQALTQMIVDAEIKRGLALDGVTADNLERSAALQLKSVDSTLQKVRSLVKDATARDGGGLQLIDVDKTRENLAAMDSALSEYIKGVQGYQSQLKALFEAATAGMDQNSIEYKEALANFAAAMDDTTQKIGAAMDEQTQNAKDSAGVQADYWEDLFGKIAGFAQKGADAVHAVTDTLSMGLQFQIDNLNEELDIIGERFSEAQEQREQAVEDVEKLEERLQSATGGTAEAIRAQLLDTMHAREEAAREEARLAKEKEKLEKEISKREKQQRKNDLISGIAQGVANTAEGVTKMLALPWPLNLVMAALVGSLGGAQVGIMTKQLTKLADGGKLEGPSHAAGGMRIQGTNVEVEGGEYVVNKRSTAANEGLLSMINSADGPVSLADLAGIADTVPAVVTDITRSNEDRIVDAIQGMDFRPVVSVVDITDAQENVTAVEELAGFS